MIPVDRLVIRIGAICLICLIGLMPACSGPGQDNKGNQPLPVPRGFAPVVAIEQEGRRYLFGPFVGYYFRPFDPADVTRLQFVCFNENGFYTDSVAAGELLYEGEAVFRTLPGTRNDIPAAGERIRPVFFEDAPADWLTARPEPQDFFVHFHSCHDNQGAVLSGYWLSHRSVTDFTYNMGGRLTSESILYHQVTQGPDLAFPRIVEFDFGP